MTTNETDRSKQAKSTDPIVSLKKAKKQKVKPVPKLRIPEVKSKPKPVKDNQKADYASKLAQLQKQLESIKEQTKAYSRFKTQHKKLDMLNEILVRNTQSNQIVMVGSKQQTGQTFMMKTSQLVDVAGRHAMTCPRLTYALEKEHMLKKKKQRHKSMAV